MRSSTLLALAALGLTASALPASAGTLLVPQQFSTIQAALNAAKSGDTVLVSAKPKGGVYNEALLITTPLVLQGVGNPIIDGTGLGKASTDNPFAPFIYPNGIEIRASHVAVRGLTVQNNGNLKGYGPGPSGINVGYVTPDGLSDVSYSDIEISGDTVRSNVAGITISGLSGVNDGVSTPKSLKNYILRGSIVTGSIGSGVSVVNTSGASVTGSQFTKNGGDGLDTNGSGIVVTGNVAAANAGSGMALNAPAFNPAVNDPKSPNPAPSAAVGNSVHDNQRDGVSMTGAQTFMGNSIAHNTGYGLYLYFADYSTVSGNAITGTTLTPTFGPPDDGTGIYADSGLFYPAGTPGGFLSITGNEISGNSGDGLFLGAVVSSTIALNSLTGNAKVGIHATDYPTTAEGTSAGNAPNTLTRNLALHNTVFDARDDASATDPLVYPNPQYSFLDVTYNGDGIPTLNVWTKNLFGTTDPVGLSK